MTPPGQLTERHLRIREMFSAIAPRYDLLNRLLSFGIDSSWRRSAAAEFLDLESGTILDLATGTGDLALELVRQTRPALRVVGVDFSAPMLRRGAKKIAASRGGRLVPLINATLEGLPFPTGSVQGAAIAFGIRNVPEIRLVLQEIRRVLEPGSKLVILELSTPSDSLFARAYRFYFSRVLPFVGGLLSGRPSAYAYLPRSVSEFPTADELRQVLEILGFQQVQVHPLTLGVANLHTGIR